MKKLFILSSLSLLVLGSAAYAASGSGTANVRIVTPISITPALSLEFGNVAAGTAADTVTVSTGGTRTKGGAVNGVTLLSGGTTARAGTFTVAGEPNAAYTISAISGINLTGGTPNIAATFTALSTSTSSATAGTLTAGGSDTITVGGTINVAANQPAANYTGTYSVVVNY